MILVTGGAGYIGSHCVVELLKRGENVVVFDNLSTGHIETIQRLQKIGSNEQFKFVKGDLKSCEDLKQLFNMVKIDAVIHFAALSQVEQSMREPYIYFQNNVSGTINLLDVMVEHKVKYIIYSSSASVYGTPKNLPIAETEGKSPINPYGLTKYTSEMILKDYDEKFGIKSVALRYFNVVGANPNGLTGEWHKPETHLVPKILKSLKDNSCEFYIFGDDYCTKDGTCIRDYVDVNDLILAHLLSLEYLRKNNKSDVFNVGTECGCSVKEIFSVCQAVTGKEISYKIADRRIGDTPTLCADITKIKEVLSWKPRYTIAQSIQNAWTWECR